MKKIISLAVTLLTLVGHMWAYVFSAVAPSGQTLYYRIINDSVVSLTCPNSTDNLYYLNDAWMGYSQPWGELIIPTTVTYLGTYTVQEIDEYAFSLCTGLHSVTIPNSVTSIGSQSFCHCYGLTSVSIGNHVTNIGYGAFYNCNVLTNVTIPNSVTSIGDYAFYGCVSIQSLTIPNSVTSIGTSAFRGLTNVHFCGSATGAPWGAVNAGCLFTEGDFTYLDSTKTTLVGYTGSSSNVTIPSTVTTIRGAFYNCTTLTNVTIPNSVTNIGYGAFYNCSGLTSVTIPNSVTSIGIGAFQACTGLSSVNIPNSVTIIDTGAFSGCESLVSVTIPNSVTNISRFAFSSCSNITNITIPNSVTSIGDYAFYDCTSITSITIPNSVTNIGNNAFENCSALTSISVGNQVSAIGSDAFEYCNSLNRVDYAGTIANWCGITFGNVNANPLCISHHLYINNSEITNLVIPNSVTRIGNWAFSRCTSLSSVNIPNSVTIIDSGAFYDCTGLTSLTIPNSVTSISSSAFSGCTSLTHVLVPNYVTSIGYNAFGQIGTVIYCGSAEGSPWGAYNAGCFLIEGDFIYTDNSKTTLVGYIGTSNTVIIPNTVTSIGSYVFGDNTTLTNVTIPNSVTSIGDGAFSGCSGLTGITIPNSVTSIGNNAFKNCSVLTNITIPNSVSNIGYQCFQYCSGLTSAIIGNSVTSLSDNFFWGCSSLVKIHIGVSLTSVGSGVFWGCDNIDTIYYNAKNCSDRLDLYNLSVLIIGDSVQTLPNSAFSFNDHLTTINCLPTTAPLLGANAFNEVTSTIPVNIPCGSLLSYTSRWNHFSNFVEGSGFSFACNTSDSTQGSVTVLTQPTCAVPTAVVYATANSGYNFARWSNGATSNPYTLTVLCDTTLTALFVANQQGGDTVYIHDTIYIDRWLHDTIVVEGGVNYYDLTVMSGNTDLGVVAGNGHFPEGTEVEIAAIPVEGNHFVRWNDNSTDNPRTVTVGSNITYVATFQNGPSSITEVNPFPYEVTAEGNRIVVKNAANRRVRIFDSVGRCLCTTQSGDEVRVFDMPAAGVYLVQVADYAAQRVVVR